jgi:hypothetical protein
VQCPQCGRESPPLDYCSRCGSPFVDREPGGPPGHRAQFAAAPDEPVWAVRLTSTLFPQLPRRDMVAFRAALVSGLFVIVLLGLFRVFAVALPAAAAVVPLLMVLYLYDVDVYEDQPLHVVAATMVWGALAGIAMGFVARSIGSSIVPPDLGQFGDGALLLRVTAIPIADLLLPIVGPLVLLRHRKFNDVLDGATFGAAAGATLMATQMLVGAWSITSEGVRLTQDSGAWSLRLFELAVLLPALAAGTAGWVCAALWLRFRAPVRDRAALGALGRPVPAIVISAVLMVAGAAAHRIPNRAGAALALGALAAVALVFLRRAIHVGLRQEADEIDHVGADVVCANCGRSTPQHTFCARCGIALRALPKRGRRS